MEQRSVLGALAALDCGPARATLKRIVLLKGLSAARLPPAFCAAAEAGLVLPAAFEGALLEPGNPAVREAAFSIALKAGVPDLLLRGGLVDPSVPVRRAAANALGNRADGAAREALIGELAVNPSQSVIEALAAIAAAAGRDNLKAVIPLPANPVLMHSAVKPSRRADSPAQALWRISCRDRFCFPRSAAWIGH